MKLLTAIQAAAYLGISSKTLYRERKAGKVGYVKIRSRKLFSTEILDGYQRRNERGVRA